MNKAYLKSIDFCVLDYPCSYLPDRQVRMNYRYLENASKELNTQLIQRGWRRFGNYFFHPICNGCNECKSLRIDVENYNFTKSQRKVIKKNRDTKVVVSRPTVNDTRLKIYNDYHLWKSELDGWDYKKITYGNYFENFVEGVNDYGREVLYFVDDKIVGVDLIDILDDGISAIYFYYSPYDRKLSLGTYSLLYQIELAKKLNLKWIYLGYWVDGCKAFEYKPRFKPQEILDGFPDISQTPNWQEFKVLPKSFTTPLEK